MGIFRRILARLRGEVSTAELVARGMRVGRNFHRMNGVWIDPGHCWLISFGDNVTLAPRATVLAHDASPQAFLGVTKVGNVEVGDNVFIGAGTIVLPGVKIGGNVIVGAGSVVTKDLAGGGVYGGNPCRLLMPLAEYLGRVEAVETEFGREYLLGAIDERRKAEMRERLSCTRFGRLARKG